MTRAEMTEIFAVLMLAYPNAEMFRAGSQQELKEKLAPTITLWTTCLRDVDAWTAQKAVVRLCQTCKYPPTIAEMREAADAVRRDTRAEISNAYLWARSQVNLMREGDTLEDVYRELPPRIQKTIDAMGGMEAFLPPGKGRFEMAAFEQTYERLLRSNPVGLPGGGQETRKLM